MISNYKLFELAQDDVLIKILKEDEYCKFSNEKLFRDADYLKRDHRVYIAIVDGKYAGGIILNLNPQPFDDEYAPELSIRRFSVKKEYRGKGIGDKLMSRVMRDNWHKKIALSTTTKTSPEALHLYKKYGFKVFFKIGKNTGWRNHD